MATGDKKRVLMESDKGASGGVMTQHYNASVEATSDVTIHDRGWYRVLSVNHHGDANVAQVTISHNFNTNDTFAVVASVSMAAFHPWINVLGVSAGLDCTKLRLVRDANDHMHLDVYYYSNVRNVFQASALCHGGLNSFVMSDFVPVEETVEGETVVLEKTLVSLNTLEALRDALKAIWDD